MSSFLNTSRATVARRNQIIVTPLMMAERRPKKVERISSGTRSAIHRHQPDVPRLAKSQLTASATRVRIFIVGSALDRRKAPAHIPRNSAQKAGPSAVFRRRLPHLECQAGAFLRCAYQHFESAPRGGGCEFLLLVVRLTAGRRRPIFRAIARRKPGPARFSAEDCHISNVKPAPSCAVPTNILKVLPDTSGALTRRCRAATFLGAA